MTENEDKPEFPQLVYNYRKDNPNCVYCEYYAPPDFFGEGRLFSKCKAKKRRVSNARICPLYTPQKDDLPLSHKETPTAQWISKNGYIFCSRCHTEGSPIWGVCPVCEAKMIRGDL